MFFLTNWRFVAILHQVYWCHFFQQLFKIMVCTFFFSHNVIAHLIEKAMAPHSSTPAWKIPWTEEPGRLQSTGSWRVGHNWVTSLSLFTFMHWRGNGNPLQCSCLENPRDGGAWWAAIYGVAQSRTRLNRLSISSSSTVNRLQYSANMSFTCTGKPTNWCDSLYFYIWNFTYNKLELNSQYLQNMPIRKGKFTSFVIWVRGLKCSSKFSVV